MVQDFLYFSLFRDDYFLSHNCTKERSIIDSEELHPGSIFWLCFSVFIQWHVEVIDRISEIAFSSIALLYGNGCWLVWEEKCFHINRSSKFVPGGTNKDVEKGISRKWRYCVWLASQQKNENLMVLPHHCVTSESHRIFRLNSLLTSLV